MRTFTYKQLNYVLCVFKQFLNYYSTLKKEIIQKTQIKIKATYTIYRRHNKIPYTLNFCNFLIYII